MVNKIKICLRCKGKASKLIFNEFCKNCYLDIIEKRIQKTLKDKLSKNCKVLIIGKETYKILERINHIPLNITIKELSFFKVNNYIQLINNHKLGSYCNKLKIDCVILPFTANDEALLFFLDLTSFNGIKLSIEHNQNKSNNNSKFVKIFLKISKKELIEYLKLIKLKSKFHKKSKNSIGAVEKLIESFESTYPGVVFSITRNKEELLNIINKK